MNQFGQTPKSNAGTIAHANPDYLGSPYGRMYLAANDFYHGVSSINKYGVIEHTAALACQLMQQGLAANEWEALESSRAQVQLLCKQAQGECLHKLAHQQLQKADAQKQQAAELRWGLAKG